jgi:pSer/pThr/pTyr-binding forkhead associated (FHA) protein
MNGFTPFGRMKKEVSITFMSGPQDGKKLNFEQPTIGEEKIISIGRREGCDIHIPFDNQISRLHARIGIVSVPTTNTDSANRPFVLTFWLEDGGSRNGTYVEKEGEPVTGRVSLRPGTLFRVGRTWMRLDIPMTYSE